MYVVQEAVIYVTEWKLSPVSGVTDNRRTVAIRGRCTNKNQVSIHYASWPATTSFSRHKYVWKLTEEDQLRCCINIH